MAFSTPASQIEALYRNPNLPVPRAVLNSGYLLATSHLAKYQSLLDEAIRKHFRDYMKYPGFINGTPAVYVTEKYRGFELLSQYSYDANNDVFLVNAGSGYDGYGNRLAIEERSLVTLPYPTGQTTAYLCVRKKGDYLPIDYMEHPVDGIPRPTKLVTELEFFLDTSILAAATIQIAGVDYYLYYGNLDDSAVANSLVIAQVEKYTGSSALPSLGVRTLNMAVKDGMPKDVEGFIDTVPAI